jgi:predicted phosphodiesterase
MVTFQVIGSNPLEAQVRRLRSDLHLFGHTHIPIDTVIDGVR